MDKKVKRIKAISIVMLLAVILIPVKLFFAGKITSVEDFQLIMNRYGLAGPVVLLLIQALQVVIPVLPGYLGCAVGAVSYGPLAGFICNYIGISIGSIIAFFLAYKYGKPLVYALFSKKMYEKWEDKFKKHKSYGIFLFVATLLPLFPDDFLCYFSGLIGMDRKKFIWIIILGKPWCILAYSIAFGLVG